MLPLFGSIGTGTILMVRLTSGSSVKNSWVHTRSLKNTKSQRFLSLVYYWLHRNKFGVWTWYFEYLHSNYSNTTVSNIYVYVIYDIYFRESTAYPWVIDYNSVFQYSVSNLLQLLISQIKNIHMCINIRVTFFRHWCDILDRPGIRVVEVRDLRWGLIPPEVPKIANDIDAIFDKIANKSWKIPRFFFERLPS